MLALLDLGVAFDMLNHPILLPRFETTLGISGIVLDWFASYLERHEQAVIADYMLSSPSPVFCRFGSWANPVHAVLPAPL